MKPMFLTLLCTLSALAQWPSDPSQNLLICDHAGEQALPKIAPTSDGGCYITWWDLASGNYDVYVQRLNADGIPQWEDPCGILVSDHPQESWLTDWHMITDRSDRCIIAVNDIRNGTDRDITAYCINSDGEFVWGTDGIAISNNDGFEPDPRIVELGDGSILFAWQNETFINMRRVSPDGADLWDPPIIEFTQANGASIPRISACDSSGFVLSYLAQQGGQFTSPRYLYLRKYSLGGDALWNPNGVAIMTTNGIGIQMRPDVVCDGSGGAYSFWYDARGNVHHCYVQRVNAQGIVQWTANGVQVDLSPNELQMSPSAVNSGFGVVIFYQTSNTNQSMGGLEAQYLSPTGQPQWNSNGVTISPLLPDEHVFNVKAFVQNGNYTVCYSQYAFGSAVNTLLRACQLGEAGQFTWSPAVSDLCDVASEKGRPNACINSLHQILAAWPDSRTAVMDIFVQNVNSSGALGPLQDIPPLVRIDAPEDGAVVHTSTVSLVFDVDHFNLGPNNREGSVLILDNDIPVDTLQQDGVYPMPLQVGQNTIRVELFDLNFQPLAPRVADSVRVTYVPPSITITWPAQPPDTLFWYNDYFPFIRFEVADFVIADSGGDGRIRLHVRDLEESVPFELSDHVVLDSLEVPVHYFTVNEIFLSLVDNAGNPLTPHIADTVYISAWQVAADPVPEMMPHNFAITSAYPNPFNSTLTIHYDVPRASPVRLAVYDVTGREVAALFDGPHDPGRYRFAWHANDLPSGVYFLLLNSRTAMHSQKVLLIK